MYKILLADNEGIVLDALIHMIYARFGETCDIRAAKTAQYTRALARKFLPDIAVINIQMPGIRGFEIVREIRSYHIKCVFITVSSYGRSAYQAEARSLNTLAHLTKPLYREKFLPVLERAAASVSRSRLRAKRHLQIQTNLDAVTPVLEHGLISQLFFPADAAANIPRYLELLNIPQNYCRMVKLTFGEPGETKNVLQNTVGSAVHLHNEYKRFRETVREYFPLAAVGPVMGNHVLFLLPYWRTDETAREKNEFSESLFQMLDALENTVGRLTFRARYGEILPIAECFREAGGVLDIL